MECKDYIEHLHGMQGLQKSISQVCKDYEDYKYFFIYLRNMKIISLYIVK